MRARITAALILISSAVAFAQNAGDWYMGKPIKDITFEGLNHVKMSELEGVIEPYIGRLFDDKLFWELQGRLYALEVFDLISPSAVPADQAGSAVVVKFVVTEKPVVSKISFEGNSGLRKNELLDAIALKVNDVVNAQKLKNDEKAVHDKYLEKGFPDISVRTETKTLKDGTLAVTFIIDEGEKIAIEALRFEGNTAFSERTLKRLLSLKVKTLLNDGAFQEAKLLADKAEIASYYQERGYVDASVVDVVREARRDEDGRNLLTVLFKINEGRQYTFNGVTFEGNKVFPTSQLDSLIYLKVGQTLNLKRLEADFQRVADLYYENGYIFNTIAKKEVRNEEVGSISYVVTIVERSRAHIENIILRGNKKTKDSVILREIPLEPGDIFSKAKVIDGMRNLYNLQYFSSVTPETPQGSADNLMDLVINVEEQPTADIQFGLTFSGTTTPDAFPISGLIKWNEKNFLGSGNLFGIELNGSPDTQKLSFQYTQKWLFGLPLSGGFDFTIGHSTSKTAQDSYGPIFNGDEEEAFPDPYYTYEDYYDASKTVPSAYLMEYEQWNVSVGFSTGYRFSTKLGSLGLGGGLRTGFVRNSYDDELYRPFDPTIREGNNQWLLQNSIWTSVSLDKRDISWDPTTGYYAMQRLSYAGFFDFEKEHYIRTDTKGEWFHTLFSFPIGDSFKFRTVLAAHSSMSFIFPQFSGDPIISYANRLAIDGTFIARGWYDERTNRGLALWDNWVELRMPVIQNVLAFDWFWDAAAVKDTPSDMIHNLEAEDFRFGLGGGFRFAIPQFPFRLSLVKRFKVVDGEIEWQEGSLFRQSNDPTSGLDFVLSFALTTN